MTETNNICIGPNAGLYLSMECYQLRLKSDTVDVSETMSEREFELITSVIRCMNELKIIK